MLFAPNHPSNNLTHPYPSSRSTLSSLREGGVHCHAYARKPILNCIGSNHQVNVGQHSFSVVAARSEPTGPEYPVDVTWQECELLLLPVLLSILIHSSRTYHHAPKTNQPTDRMAFVVLKARRLLAFVVL
jgi:hypothetical protein